MSNASVKATPHQNSAEELPLKLDYPLLAPRPVRDPARSSLSRLVRQPGSQRAALFASQLASFPAAYIQAAAVPVGPESPWRRRDLPCEFSWRRFRSD